ncbi:methyltransferase family protein [Palleronia aestuarii]|uniref:Methyltransferase family protein n=1 Tax=Palleronia aestuarii TaxID=568105 RepID=A0A2W7NGX8_9RHOB|nr:class I SAM-dependent methyltransferase [Palleronia aestuarii]PZX19110.1 methyltransferase family protein [Palleronia aestuarii]
MTIDQRTLDVYAALIDDYVEKIAIRRAGPSPELDRFVRALPEGTGAVLDWGAGMGQSASLLEGLGVRVEATDASREMADVARELGITVRIEPFEALEPGERFRGIWSHISLCHAPRDAISGLVALAHSVLVPGGIFYMTSKAGSGEGRDTLGRFFSYWEIADLDRITSKTGLEKMFASEYHDTGFTGQTDRCVIHMSRKPDA